MFNQNYKELKFFQDTIDLVPIIYEITKNYPKEEQGFTGIVSQLRRASVSIASNIAEGTSRDEKEFFRFLKISLGSLREVETQIKISRDLNYINEEKYNQINESINRILGRMTNYMKLIKKTVEKLEEERFEKIRKAYGREK